MLLQATGHIYLMKSSNELVSCCRCPDAFIASPAQMDCPWCGCGWLFICMECQKAFTFAKGVIVPESWEQTAVRELRNRWGKEPDAEAVSQWVEAMKELLADVRVGEEYVYLDGLIIPRNTQALCFEGWHSRHGLPFVPQVAALGEPSVLASVLENESYWKRGAVT